MNEYTAYELSRIITIQSIISSFEITYHEDFYFDGEMHNFWELVCVLDGKIGVTADNRIHTLSKGQLIFHKPMEFHRLWSEAGTKPHLIIMSFEAEGKGIEKFKNGIFQLNYENEILLLNIMKILPEAFEVKDYYPLKPLREKNPIALQMIATNLELFMLSILNNVTTEKTLNNSSSAMNYRNIITMMDQYKYENLTVSRIAYLCNMSTSNLKKVFRKYSGKGVMEYFNHIKIRESIYMLERGLPINEISDKLAFSSQNYFSTVFKRETGYSPTKYRDNRLNVK